MPATFWERDAAYKRRINVIAPCVVAAYAILFFATDQIRYEDIPRVIGWRGELEVLPEITVVPTVLSIEAEPAPREETPRETVALNLSSKGDMPEEHPAQQEPEQIQQRIVEPAQGTAQIRAMEQPGHREPTYTNDFVLLRAVTPVYPPYEKQEGIEGMVTVEMLVDENGRVAEANALSVMGPDSFSESALDAVRQFLFEPPLAGGQPTTIWVRLRIKFRITG
jgi:protein TonB